MPKITPEINEKSIIARRSRFLPVLFLILGSALLCGAVWYAISLSAGASESAKPLLIAMLCVFGAGAAILLLSAARDFSKPSIAAIVNENGAYLYMNRLKDSPVFIPRERLTDCKYARTRSSHVTISRGTLYFYTPQKAYKIGSVKEAQTVCLAIRAEIGKNAAESGKGGKP